MTDRIELTDDGTMDTVVRCRVCGAEARYNYDPESWEPTEGPANGRVPAEQNYDDFVAWAIEDFDSEHDCEDTE